MLPFLRVTLLRRSARKNQQVGTESAYCVGITQEKYEKMKTHICWDKHINEISRNFKNPLIAYCKLEGIGGEKRGRTESASSICVDWLYFGYAVC